VYHIIERHTLRYIPTILLYVENPIEQQQQPKLLLFDGGPPPSCRYTDDLSLKVWALLQQQ
jgi:hypothetical protein